MEVNRMYRIIKKAIDEFNPYNLLPDAPDDEFDRESREIAGKISINSTKEEIAGLIVNVFSRGFGENFGIKDCMETAEKIYESLKLDN